jgi:lysophospholipase L1-like esterase
MQNFNKNNSFGRVCLTLLFLAQFFMATSQEYQVRIACMGNSITAGAGLPNPATQSYPGQLGSMLKEKFGDTCVVRNFGNSGRTMLKHGDFPLWNEAEFTNAMAWAPNICLISLGTNDTKPYNWDVYGHEFYDDYMAMIDTFRVRNPFVKFIVCYPAPAFAVAWDIRDSVIVHGVIPAIDSVLANTDATLVDFYTPLVDSAALFPDNIHPNVQGSKVMAQIIYNKIIETDLIHHVETGLPFITKFTSNRPFITVNDSTKITWEAINTEIVYFDQQMVSPTGSNIMSPDETTVYTMVAKNKKYSDTVTYTVSVYEPKVGKITISKSLSKVYVGDTCLLTAKLIDQYSYPITGMVVPLEWTLKQGDGQFLDAGDNSIHYKSISPGLKIIQASFENVMGGISFTVKENPTGITINEKGAMDFNIFPNPVADYLVFNIPGLKTESMHVDIIDLKGITCISEDLHPANNELNGYKIDVKDLHAGVYIYHIYVDGSTFSGKLVKGK